MWWWRKQQHKESEQPYFEKLEPRILYSADLGAGLLAATPGAQQEEQRLLDASGEYIAPRTAETLTAVPLSFEANVGQTDAQVDFQARGSGYEVFLARGDATIVLEQGDGGHVVKLELMNAAPATVSGHDALQARSNYLIGNDPTQWHTDIPHYGSVGYAGVYDGINLLYYGNQRQLEYDFVVQAGADPNQIRLKFEGADRVSVDDKGDLVLSLGAEKEIRFLAPVSYQVGEDGRDAVAGRYVLLADGTVGFSLDAYDSNRELVIDPVLSYFTYFGGGLNEDTANGIALDGGGNVYLAGMTRSTDFPATAGVFQGTLAGASDAYVAKLDPTLSTLLFATYIGSTGVDQANAIAVDSGGNAWVTGSTTSAAFPTFNSPYMGASGGGQDGFVFKLNATGTALLYSTYLGSSGSDEGRGIAVDGSDNAYAVGMAGAAGFPTTPGVVDSLLSLGSNDAFLTKFSSSGTVAYSTLLGGLGVDVANAVAVDSTGNAYVVGNTTSLTSLDFTGAALLPGFSTLNAGGMDAFVAKVNSTATAYSYFTFLGGAGSDNARAIALDSTNRAHIAGDTNSAAFPKTATPYDTVLGGIDGFVTVLNAAGTALVYSSYFGGAGTDIATGIGVDAAGRIYLAGYTDNSTGFPSAMKALAGQKDIFVAQLNPAGGGTSDLLAADLHGGAGIDEAYAAVRRDDRLYVAGSTTSSSIATAAAFKPTYSGGDPKDGFAAMYAFGVSPVLANASAVSYVENDPALLINSLITVSDVDSTTLASSSVAITNFVAGQDVLSFINDGVTMGNIAASFNGGTGVLSLISAGATATLAQWQSALRVVRYANSSDNPNTATRNVTFIVNDGGTSSNSITSTVSVTAVNDAPVLANASAVSYVENDPALLINSLITVSDADNATLASASVAITNFVAGQDVLSFANDGVTMGNIAASFNGGT